VLQNYILKNQELIARIAARDSGKTSMACAQHHRFFCVTAAERRGIVQ